MRAQGFHADSWQNDDSGDYEVSISGFNTCVMMMFIWATERFKLDLVSYDCDTEGVKLIELDRTETFAKVALRPRIVVRASESEVESAQKGVQRALESAVKYSLVANSIKSEIVVEPNVEIIV
ncbi:MAG TPA: OsmC family protein [Acidobacteriota bacterium]|nr:OsmC family protein [Acidobacteriota bacterium]